MWSLDFIRRKNHDKQGARGKKWRFFHNFATFVRERLHLLLVVRFVIVVFISTFSSCNIDQK